ncbi:unnamed protein product [Amoebophrya sp. A120]|nr:unnamed protein product [Amoebophrya sp. A120]|eukprot:GSA120T00021701001.1
MNEIYANFDEDQGPYRIFSKLKQTLEQNLTKMYRALDVAEREPKFLQRTKINPEVQDRLMYFNQLMFVLQSQPAFISRLGTRMPNTKPELDALWMRFVECLFRDRGNIRVRTVFKALIRLVMIWEADCTNTFEDLFAPTTKTARLFEYLACGRMNWFPSANAEYVTVHGTENEEEHQEGGQKSAYGRVFSRILDVSNDKSLLALVFQYTIARQNKQKEDVFWGLDADACYNFKTKTLRSQSGHKHAALHEEGVGDEDERRHLYQESGKHMKHFLQDVFFPQFFNKLTNLVSRDLACLLQRAYLVIEDLDIAYHYTTKASGKDLPDPRICMPMMNLLLGHYVAPLLIKAENQLTPYIRLQLKQKCRKILVEERNVKPNAPNLNLRVLAMMRHFYENVKALGMLLKKTVTGDWNAAENLMHGISAKQVVPTVLSVLTHGVAGPKNLVDSTETELTIDLYARHFNPGLAYVQIATSDLLKMCNVMYTCIHENEFHAGELEDHEVDIRMDPKGTDVLERLINFIQPVPSVQAGEKRPERYEDLQVRLWPREKIIAIEQNESMHNFTVDHRFILHYRLLEGDDQSLPGPVPLTFREKFLLEDKKKVLPKDQKVVLLNRMREVCFCRESQVSMPRFLTGAGQKSRSGVRYVKPYQPAPAQLPKGAQASLKPILPSDQDGFRFLELLLRDVSEVKSKDFLSLKYEFEEKQRVYQQLIPPNYELADRLERAKKVLDILKTAGVKEKEFATYVDEALQARAEHFAYLEQVENGKQKVIASKESYRSQMAILAQTTEELSEFARLGAIEKSIRQKGMDYNLKLKIPSIEKVLQKQVGGSLPAFRQYSVGYLRAKKIVVRLGEHIAPDLVRNLHLEFRQISEYIGKTVYNQWEVLVMHKDERNARRNLLTFYITMEELDLMRESSGKLAKMDWADKFITFQCNALLQMLVRI